MFGVAIYIVTEAIGRIGHTAHVATTPMLIVGAIGLVINLIALFLLRPGAADSLNVKGAYLEVAADTAGSVGVIVAGWLVTVTGQPLFDTLVALAIGTFVVGRAVVLGRQVLAVLAQHVPEGIDTDAVAATLAAIDDVQDVHDLHVWTLISGMHVATAHLVTTDQSTTYAVLDQAGRLLRERYGIAHATLQIEPAAHTGCEQLTW